MKRDARKENGVSKNTSTERRGEMHSENEEKNA